MNRDLSMFGEFQAETFRQAAQIRPEAAKVWLEQLAQIDQQQLDNIFAQIPGDRIKPEAKAFAQELLSYNHNQLLNFRSELDPSLQDLSSLYQRYSQDTKTQGLAEAVEIAKNALAEGIDPEQIVEMLADNNAAYQKLVAQSDVEQARQMIVRKAEMELSVSQDRSSSNEQSKQVRRSPRKS